MLVLPIALLRPSVVASRFEALRGSALTRLVGRGEQIDLLLRRWARAKAGDGQVVLVSGEPGLGKSRIVAALAERLHAEPHVAFSVFLPIIFRLEARTDAAGGLSPQAAAAFGAITLRYRRAPPPWRRATRRLRPQSRRCDDRLPALAWGTRQP